MGNRLMVDLRLKIHKRCWIPVDSDFHSLDRDHLYHFA